ncbi:expressed unknown protein [Seminavis robusta]|uniref:Uncharacterized protein n=1 Tax=Seminavis robusta TaxID=568900 RepID=A0A9N8DC99_9STRA|nr:expressed unknown protein [Seminavis robusta]|eukprot:Sro82_g043830.1 n/a (362) ;mRNA; r:54041-55126
MEESSGAPTAVVAFSRSSDHTTVRDSIKDVFAELQKDDEGVRPSVVAAALKAKQAGVTSSINTAPPDTPKSHDVDYDAVQALLAALSFTPSESSVSSSSDDGSVKKRFDFASPVKNAPSTPWVKRVQTTPPTASTTYDEDDEDEDVSQMVITPSLEKHTNHHETPMRDTSDSAAAAAYPLSLPNRDNGSSHSHADDNVSTVSSPRGRRHSHKPCKKFPKVSTDIPGAGVTRSSVGLKKGAVKLPFVHIAAPGGAGETVVALRKHHQQHHPALHVYQHAKEAWAWGKGNALLISPIMGMAEGIVGMAAGITGQGDLETVDHNLLTPLVSAVDDVILGPVAHVIGGVLSGLFGGGGEDHDGRN